MLVVVAEDWQTSVLVLMVRQSLLVLVVAVTVRLPHGQDFQDRFPKVETLQLAEVVVVLVEVVSVVVAAQASSFSNGYNKWQSVEDSTVV
jgi:hypothetical protein